MTDAHFDTMAAVQMLRQAGIADRQAEAIVTALVESQHNLATKDDVQQLRLEVEAGFAQMRTEMNAGFAQLRTEMGKMDANLRKVIAESQRSMTTSLGVAAATVIAVLGSLMMLTQ